MLTRKCVQCTAVQHAAVQWRAAAAWRLDYKWWWRCGGAGPGYKGNWWTAGHWSPAPYTTTTTIFRPQSGYYRSSLLIT